jgi:hypothetical protein
MMRILLASMAALAASVSSAFAPPAAIAAHARFGPSVARSRSSWRVLRLIVSPAPGDFVLEELGFRGAGRGKLSASSLHVMVKGAFGDDYVAGAWLSTPAGRRALVLVVNRPSPLLDPSHVQLVLRWQAWLGSPFRRAALNPLAVGAAPAPSALCVLEGHDLPLGSVRLHVLGTWGTRISAITPANAIAEAYDASCGRPVESAFAQALSGACSERCEPTPTPPPETAPPGCGRCDPRPGYACPLVATPAVCVASPGSGARRTSTGSY